MKLYTLFRSSAAYRARIALNLKGIAFESIPKALVKNEHRTRRVPCGESTGPPAGARDGDGAVLSQSLAIIEYLDETHPTPSLLPSDPLARAHVRSMALAIACDIHPVNNLRILNYLKGPLKQDEADGQRAGIGTGSPKASEVSSNRCGSIQSRNAIAMAMRCRSPISASSRRCTTPDASRPTSRRFPLWSRSTRTSSRCQRSRLPGRRRSRTPNRVTGSGLGARARSDASHAHCLMAT